MTVHADYRWFKVAELGDASAETGTLPTETLATVPAVFNFFSICKYATFELNFTTGAIIC